MSNNIKEIISVFLKLGLIAFGGPAAHIAMMEDEIIRKRKWMDHQHFLDLMGVTNLIPGPNSTEMVMHCGYERGGWKGLFAAGFSFITPAVIITCILAWAYQEYGTLPEVQPFLYGIKPAVIAIIISALYKLGKKALKNWELGVLGAMVVAACLLGVHEILALFSCGLLGVILFYVKKSTGKTYSFFPIIPLAVGMSKLNIFLSFLKVGAILYGSGYVLFAFLDAELVSTGILSRGELIDAVAVGQMTPGPVLSTASFIGWQLGSWQGALLSTLGIFLPSFIFVGLINKHVHKIRKSPLLGAFLDAVNIAAVAVILAVCIEMGKESIMDWRTALIALLSLGFVFGLKKMNAAFIVVLGSIIGYGLSLI